jgi:hypothetical protein
MSVSDPAPTPEDAEAALAELLEVAALMVTTFVWSPEALPLAERLAAAVNRVTETSQGWRDGAGQE